MKISNFKHIFEPKYSAMLIKESATVKIKIIIISNLRLFSFYFMQVLDFFPRSILILFYDQFFGPSRVLIICTTIILSGQNFFMDHFELFSTIILNGHKWKKYFLNFWILAYTNIGSFFLQFLIF